MELHVRKTLRLAYCHLSLESFVVTCHRGGDGENPDESDSNNSPDSSPIVDDTCDKIESNHFYPLIARVQLKVFQLGNFLSPRILINKPAYVENVKKYTTFTVANTGCIYKARYSCPKMERNREGEGLCWRLTNPGSRGIIKLIRRYHRCTVSED